MAPTMRMASSLAPAAPPRTFFPRSRVLKERRPVTFESDDEGNAELSPLPLPLSPPRVTTTDGTTTTATEIAYVHDGRVTNERFDLRPGDQVTALQSLPPDTWTALLDESDRRRLAACLPSLDGWNDMANEDAQRVTVEALLARENLHFGNPLTTLEAEVKNGQRTIEAVRAREAYKKQAMARFALDREKMLRTRQEAIIKSKKEKEQQAQNDARAPQWKKMRVASQFPIIHSDDSQQTVLVSENTSLFLALKSVMTDAKLTVEEVVDKLRLCFPRRCALVENGIPLFLTFEKYIKAALTFLGGEHATAANSTHWSAAVFVQFDAESKQYEWRSEQTETEVRNLLLLEQVFRAPVASDFLDYSNNSSGVKATRKRRERVLSLRARDALLASDAEFAALDAYRTSRPSVELKRSLLERDANAPTGSG